MEREIRVTVWCEHNQDKREPVLSVYPRGMHDAIAEGFREEPGFRVRTATQDEPDHGLRGDVLATTDVLVWWSHLDNNEFDDAVAHAVCHRVINDGMGLIVLHSATFSKPWQMLMGIHPQPGGWGRFRTMPKGEKERLWVITPGHPIVEGIGDCVEIPGDEMYGEPLLIPDPQKIIFIAWWEGGDVCRSGCVFERGRGKVFQFTPGHEAFPIYYQSEIRRVLRNAARWMAPSAGVAARRGEEHLSGEARENLSHKMKQGGGWKAEHMAWSKTKKAGIHHVCLRVPDLRKTADFYRDGLGATLVVEWGAEGGPDHAFILDLGAGDFLEIFQSQEDLRMGKWQHVAVITDDVAASVARALSAGATLLQEQRESHIPARSGEVVHMRFAFIRAPGGETVEFIQNI